MPSNNGPRHHDSLLSNCPTIADTQHSGVVKLPTASRLYLPCQCQSMKLTTFVQQSPHIKNVLDGHCIHSGSSVQTSARHLLGRLTTLYQSPTTS